MSFIIIRWLSFPIFIFSIFNCIYGKNSIEEYRIEDHKSILSSMVSFQIDSSRHITKGNYLKILSSFKINNQIPEILLGLSLKGSIGNISYMLEPLIVNAYYGQRILGVNYSRNDFSGRVEKASISINNEYFKLKFGREPVNWGLIRPFSIIQSGIYPPYDNILFGIKNGKFLFEILHGQLNSEINVEGYRIKRNIAGHRLLWKNDILSLCFGEQIIYTGVNRGIEMAYINPFIPYFFTGLEGEEVTKPKDNDNSIIFFYNKYRLFENLSIYSEFIIDDFQVDKESISDHAIGYKLGCNGRLKLNNKEQLWLLEYSYISPWTYIHHGQNTNWNQRGHAIGFPYGPNSQYLQLQFLGDLNNKYYFFIDLGYLIKGNNDLNTVWDNLDKGNINKIENTEHIIGKISINRDVEWGIVECGWSYTPFYNEVALNHSIFPDVGSFFLKFKIKKEFSSKK